MKKLAIILLFLPLFSGAQNKGVQFKIAGSIQNPPPDIDWLFISYSSDGERKRDSVKVKEGKYFFKGVIAEPVMASIWVKYTVPPGEKPKTFNFKRDEASVFLEKGKIKVTSKDSLGNKSIKGSAIHKQYVKMMKSAEPYNERLSALNKKYADFRKNNDDVNLKKTQDEIDKLYDEKMEAVYAQYARTHPSSVLALYAVKQYAGWEVDAVKVEPLFNMLSLDLQALPSGIELKGKIETAKKTAIGRDALDFTQNDTLGVPVSLSSFRGKYILVDFWASWCGPCRVENPNLVKAYNKYREQGFHILGVSLDRPGQKERWMKAIHDDRLEWTHVSDLKFWNNEVAVLYGIHAIPQNLLIDPGGKIVAKNLHGEELEKKLEEFIIEGKKIF